MVPGVSSFQQVRNEDMQAKKNAQLAAEKIDEHTAKDFAKKPHIVLEKSTSDTTKSTKKKKGKKGQPISQEEP